MKDNCKVFPAEQGEHCALLQGLHAQFGPPVLKRQGIQSGEDEPWVPEHREPGLSRQGE